MSISPSRTPLSSPTPALQQLQDWLEQRRASGGPTGDLEAFEEHLHTLVMAVERDAIAEELVRYDLDTSEITIDGVRHRRVLRCAPALTATPSAQAA